MTPRYEYKTINVSHYVSVEDAANSWAEDGWRVAAAIGSRGPGYADSLILERMLEPSYIIMQEHRPRKKRRWWNRKK